MQPPQVQSIDQIINDLNPAYAPQTAVLQQQQAQLPAKYASQKTALDAAKVQGFNQINDQATSRGMSFSGIPLNEQANYLSTKYLPGMQQLDFQQNSDMLQLNAAMAQINQERTLRALDTRDKQQSALQNYLYQQQQMQWEKEKFNAQMALDQQKLAAENARYAQQSAGPTEQQWLQQAFESAAKDPNWQKDRFTESNILGQFNAAFGYAKGSTNAVYDYRKKYYGF